MCKHKRVKALFLTLNGETLYHCPDCRHMILPSWWTRLPVRKKQILKLAAIDLILLIVLYAISR